MTTAYTGIPNGDIDQDSPVTQELITALRDDPIAIAEGAIGAPVTAAGWHPYNSTLNGTGDGKFYDFAVHGAVASIETPAFADGYEYMIIFDDLKKAGTGVDFRIELYRDTAAAYSSAFVLLSPVSTVNGKIELPQVRRSMGAHVIISDVTGVTSTTPVAGGGIATVFAHSAAQKIGKARVSFTTNTSAGKLYLYRRSLQ
ncbi:MAG: hypothetical protein A3D16_12110 [Rhodobacterales bacterium RIFCSPHIGHO2_02_FULL_62_130]|nr:MAG: hypothetical protein A3D16_12110 [Rhodobacterales bacterium RIFCSPHIGHO2_02_FULL_62_130]OHC53847.1 MAG: hypothetical protein A3E48_23130 [Rhodobacterales bacterium RIFCSPHIGHO2_12_FULL_62_75]HCZ00185.1 hypothetical protein [Rhodobacter sp.]